MSPLHRIALVAALYSCSPQDPPPQIHFSDVAAGLDFRKCNSLVVAIYILTDQKEPIPIYIRIIITIIIPIIIIPILISIIIPIIIPNGGCTLEFIQCT